MCRRNPTHRRLSRSYSDRCQDAKKGNIIPTLVTEILGIHFAWIRRVMPKSSGLFLLDPTFELNPLNYNGQAI